VLWLQKANKKLTTLYEKAARGESIGNFDLERRASMKYTDFNAYKVFLAVENLEIQLFCRKGYSNSRL
jgi:hypothetical protein